MQPIFADLVFVDVCFFDQSQCPMSNWLSPYDHTEPLLMTKCKLASPPLDAILNSNQTSNVKHYVFIKARSQIKVSH